MASHIERRKFLAALGGAAAAWPLAARAQQPAERVRRIGVLVGLAEDDPEGQARIAAFRQGLEKRGWSLGAASVWSESLLTNRPQTSGRAAGTLHHRRSLGGAWETGPLLYCPTERERSARWLSIDHSQRAPLRSSQAPVIVRYR
jgi:hypothetical protein